VSETFPGTLLFCQFISTFIWTAPILALSVEKHGRDISP